MPPSIRSALAAHDQQIHDARDALQANYYLHHGHPELAKKLMDANKALVAIVVLSPAQKEALAFIGFVFGQAVEDQVRFDIVTQLTGLSAYIKDYVYNPNNRTFQVNFTSSADVSEFLANSPYFAGPGIALLHLDVGTFDYRSETDLTGGLSLQVVPGRNSSAGYADFDRFNPYQDPYSLIRHNIPIILHGIARIFR